MAIFCPPLLTLLLLFVATGTQALVLVAAELPPYVIRAQQGNPSGMAIEIMEEAARRLKEPLTIELMPFARALTEVTHRKDVMLVPSIRTAEREHTYHWIAPLMDEELVVVSDRHFHPMPLKFAQLKQLDVGTLRYSSSQYLLKKRFNKQSFSMTSEALNAHKLHRGRIDAWVSGWNVILYNQQQEGFSPDRLVRGETLIRIPLFVAANKEFSPTEGRRWQQAIDSMREDGSLSLIVRQYSYQAPTL